MSDAELTQSQTPPPQDIDERIAELEAQLAFQEDSIHKLNNALVDQHRRVEILEVAIKHYEKRLAEIQHGVGDGAAPGLEDEVPPHY